METIIFNTNLNLNKLLLSFFLFTSVSGCQADNSIGKTLYNTLKVDHDFTIYQRDFGAEEPIYSIYTTPQIFIQAVTPVKCEDRGNGNHYDSSINGCILQKPLPESLTLRYGKWLTRNEEEKQFPPIPFSYSENQPKTEDYKSYEEFKKAHSKYWNDVFNLPQFKKIKEAKQKSIDNIQWHTITIHPQAIMNKYKGKIPHEEVKSFARISPYLWSTELTLFITVNPDMSVILTEDYHFQQSGKPSFH